MEKSANPRAWADPLWIIPYLRCFWASRAGGCLAFARERDADDLFIRAAARLRKWRSEIRERGQSAPLSVRFLENHPPISQVV